MDPMTMFMAGSAVLGLATQAFGSGGMFGSAKKQNQISQQESAVSQQEFQTEEQMNQVRRQSMELYADRQRLEVARKTQLTASQGQAIAVNQGAQFGSGFFGGQAQSINEGAWNTVGINQNEDLGEKMFDLTGQLDQQKAQMAALGTQMSSAQSSSATSGAIAGMGSTLIKDLPAIGNLGGQIGGMNFNSLFGGNSPSGYGTN
jgi:hypothetical protein